MPSEALDIPLPDNASSALVRKLGALCLMSDEEITFMEGLQNHIVDIEKGRDFVEEGSDLRTTCVISEGWAVRYIMLEDGRRQILSYALPGDIIGLHINFRAQATYSAAALTPLKVATIDPRRMTEISQKFPVLAAGLSWCTAREFAILGDQTVRLGRLAAPERLAHFLLELWHRLDLINEVDGTWIDMPMTQSDLADTLGLSLVHTNRSLKTLRDANLVTVTRDAVRLDDVNALMNMSHFNPDHLTEFSI
ncbi:Crp/Fnr family transcriptional regulator [Roseobacter sp. CCS2]|uniref:Crp/Fnr family transcriptional regulator n=1 Tax=Roseobacter sp. CCS2 TaxID=391593 RepID=UPI0000F3F141|nr:Crp/Fnr family transcriptional regulator [Roseobacter sp. CCS2]EBA11138.1 Cyclic nucleotide-binding domain (cNMP-BD) protein [Roseobacter sp. CCS2]